MRRGVLPLLLLGVVGGGVVWWAASGPLTPRGESAIASASTARNRTASGDAAASEVAATDVGARTDAQRSTEQAPVGEPPPLPPGVELEPPLEHGIPIAVVDKESGKPQPFALVTWFDGEFPRGDFLEELTPEQRNVDWMLDHAGRVHRADEKGLLRVARSPSSTEVELYARCGDRLGVARLSMLDQSTDEKAAPLRLEVEPRRLLRIQVVDATGQPVTDVELALNGGHESQLVGAIASITTAAPDGIAEFRGAQLLFRPDDASFEPTYTFEFAERHATQAKVKRGDLDGPPIRLTMPAVGSVELVAVDPHGVAVPADARIDVNVLGAPRENNPWSGSSSDDDEIGTQTAHFVHGRATLRFVVVGAWLEGDATFDEWGHATLSAAGPKVAGEHVRVETKLDGRSTLLRGRVVDEQGAPVQSKTLLLHLRRKWVFPGVVGQRREQLWEEDVAVRTRADGSFQIGLTLNEYEHLCAGDAELCHRTVRGATDLAGVCVLSDAVAASGGDVGTVTLRAPPLIASGSVVDDRGEPVEGVWIGLQNRDVVVPPDRRLRQLGYEAPARPVEWTTVTDRAGRFELRGEPKPGHYELLPRQSQLRVVPPTPIEVGATDVKLVVARAASLTAHVLVDAGVPFDAVLVVVTQRPEGASEDVETNQTPDARGDVVFEGLEPRPVKVSARIAGFGAESENVVVADGVALAGGELTRDPRLAAIDLRGRCEVTRVVVVDEEGAPVRSGTVELARPKIEPNADPESSVTDDTVAQDLDEGATTIVTVGARPDVEVKSTGFRTRRVTLTPPLMRVALQRSLEVVVVVEPPLPRLPDGVELYATLKQKEGDDEENGPMRRVSGDSPQPLRLDASGTYHLQLFLADESNLSEIEAARTTVVVTDNASRQTIRVHLAPEALAAALKEFHEQ